MKGKGKREGRSWGEREGACAESLTTGGDEGGGDPGSLSPPLIPSLLLLPFPPSSSFPPQLGDYTAALNAMNDLEAGGKGGNLSDIASKRAVQRMEQMSAQLASMSEEKRLLGEKLSSTVEDQKR
jgi:hypothetical protein